MSGSIPLRDEWQTPHLGRLAPTAADYDEIIRRHDEACTARIPNYADPMSGLRVFTASFLAERDSCCSSGCRHCPYIV